jgi:2-amino-4-hydroxy-6-hydroxymethyldihydropteridine diphosphokinase
MIYHLGLGSNRGKSGEHLARARRLLAAAGIVVRKASSLYRTEPVGFRGQAWFLNQVLEVETELSPWELLGAVKALEARMGRRPGPRNGPRLIDIDILLAEDTVVRTATLTVPHARLEKRKFALAPLAEIVPGAIHPVLRLPIGALLALSKDRARVEKAAPAGRIPRRAR